MSETENRLAGKLHILGLGSIKGIGIDNWFDKFHLLLKIIQINFI